ncbi:tetratricopeptide repeat protein [Vulgatibacter incomptus]|nr:tetratricopeptide repeat protein [Vulgatibacter incomptus]
MIDERHDLGPGAGTDPVQPLSFPNEDTPAPSAPIPDAPPIARARDLLEGMPAGSGAADPIAALEREVAARGDDPSAAALLHEIGRHWEERRKSPRHAAIAYQKAFRLDRSLVPNLQAARRLFSEVGNWPLVAHLLETEVDAERDPAARSRLLFERGLVFEEHLAKPDEATACFERALELDPGNLALLAHLPAATKDPETRAGIHERTAEVVSDPRLASIELGSAAHLLEGVDVRRSLELLRGAYAKDPGSPVVRARLERKLEQAGAREELRRLYESELERATPESAPWLCRRISRLHLEDGREDEAVEALVAGRRLAPRDPLILGELARLLELRGAWDALAEVLVVRAEATVDDGEKAALHLELAAIFDARLEQPERAIEHYREALRLTPGNDLALASLGRLQHQRGDWDGLYETFETEAALAQDPRQKAARSFKAARILEERLDRVDDAIAIYDEILRCSPGFLPAQKALARLYAGRGRFDDLVALMERELADLEDRDTIIAALAQLAEVHETKRRDLPAAIACHRRILAVAPGHLATIRSLARLAEQLGDWEELLRAHEAEATYTGDQRQVVSLLHQNAEILEEQLGDKGRAIEAWRKVLAITPAYLPALRSLGRLYAQKGLWSELIRMHRQEAQVAPRDEASELIFRIGELQEEKLCDEARAIDAFREVLASSPGHFPAMRRLARIFRGQGAWRELAELLRLEASTRTDPGERAAALFQVAEILEAETAGADEAARAYEDVLREDPRHVPALRALERILGRSGDTHRLAGVLETLSSQGGAEDRVAAWSKLTALCLDELGDTARAARSCEAGLTIAPNDLFLLRCLERIRGGGPRRADARARIASAVSDPRVASALLVGAALDRGSSSSEAASDELERAVDADPRNERASELLERQLVRRDEPAKLAALLERRASTAADAGLRVSLLVRIGELREARLADTEGAIRSYKSALDHDPEHLPALVALARLLEPAGDLRALRDVWLASARAQRAATGGARALARAGELSEALRETEAAEAHYSLALERDPAEATALARLEALAIARGEPAKIAAFYESRARTAASPSTSDLAAAARIHLEQLVDPARAAALLDEALAAEPGNAEAQELRGRVAEALGDPHDAIARYERLLRQGDDSAAARSRLGRLRSAIGDAHRALLELEAALAVDPSHREALALRAKLLSDAERWAEADEALRRLIEVEDDLARLVPALEERARVLEVGLRDLAGAAACLEAILERTPEAEATLERLALLYERARDLPRLVSALERWSTRLLEPGQAIRASAALAKAASILAGPLQARDRAVVAYERALEWSPGDREIRLALAGLHAADPSTQDAAIRAYRLALEEEPGRASSHRALLRIWQSRGETDRAFVAAAVLHLLRASDAEEEAFYYRHHELPHTLTSTLEPAVLRDPDSKLRALAGIAAVLSEPIARASGAELARWDVERGDRLEAGHPVRRLLDRIFAILGSPSAPYELYSSARENGVGVAATLPPAVIVSKDFGTRYRPSEQTFLLARAAWGIREGSALWASLPRKTLAELVGAAVLLIHPDATSVEDPGAEEVRRLGKVLGRKGKRALEAPVRQLLEGPRDATVDDLVRHAERSANRLGLLLSGDLPASFGLLARGHQPGRPLETEGAVLEAIERRPELAELLLFAVSDEHAALRRRLGLAVTGA